MEKIKIKLTPQMQECAKFFKGLGKTYFVGGCVRDIIMGNEPHDYDLITNKEPDEIIAYMKANGRRAYLTGKRYGTISCKIGPNNEMTEVTTFRSDIYDFKSRKPIVKFSKFLDEDLNRRDFTINSLVADMDGNVKDLKGGLEDLKNKVLRTVGNSKQRMKEDPLRILRGIRFAAKYGLEIEKMTNKRLKTCRWELLRLSKERVIEETNKILLLEPEKAFKALLKYWEYNIWQIIFPAMQLQLNFNQRSPYHEHSLVFHTLYTFLEVRKEPILRTDLNCLWVALLHDVGKPFTQTDHKSGEYCNYINHDILGADLVNDFCTKYKFSNKDREFIVKSVKEHIKEDSWLKPFDNKSKRIEKSNAQQISERSSKEWQEDFCLWESYSKARKLK